MWVWEQPVKMLDEYIEYNHANVPAEFYNTMPLLDPFMLFHYNNRNTIMEQSTYYKYSCKTVENVLPGTFN